MSFDSGAPGRLLRNGLIYTLASAASTASTLLITPFLTRHLGLPEYDKVAVALVIMNISINFLALGLPTAIIRAAHTDRGGAASARGVTLLGFTLVLIASGLTAAILQLFGPGGAVAWALVAGGASGGVAMVMAYFVAIEDARTYVIVSFGLSLGGPLAGLVNTLLVGPEASNYFGGLAIGYLSVGAAGMCLLARRSPLVFSAPTFFGALRIGLPMVPHQLAVGTAGGAAVLLAATALPPGAAAYTQLALLIGSAPLVIVSAMSNAWTPIVLSTPVASRGLRLAETSSVISRLAAFGGGALAMLAPWFSMVVAPQDQFNVSSMTPLVAISTSTATLGVAYMSHLQIVIGAGRTLRLALLSPLALALGFVIGWVMVPFMGVPASSMVFVAVYVLFFVFTRTLARLVSPIRWAEYRVMTAVGAAAVFSVVGALLPWSDVVGASIRIAIALVLLTSALLTCWPMLRSGALREAK